MADIFQAYPDRSIPLKYEELIAHPSRALAPVFKMLGAKPINLGHSAIQVPASLRRAFTGPEDRRFLQDRFPDVDARWPACSACDILREGLGVVETA